MNSERRRLLCLALIELHGTQLTSVTPVSYHLRGYVVLGSTGRECGHIGNSVGFVIYRSACVSRALYFFYCLPVC